MKTEDNISKIFIYCLAGLLLGITSCKKFLEIPPPNSQLVSSDVFTSAVTATSALTSIYAQMNVNGNLYSFDLATGSSSDEIESYSSDPGFEQYYQNALKANIESNGDIWQPAYNYIYQANAVLAGLHNNSAITGQINNQLTGEAEFIRAFWYFGLINVFGDVPLVTTINYQANQNLTRTPQAQVYKQIIADLIDAKAKLNSNYVDGTDTSVTTERVRPTKFVAGALLARVYLYYGNLTNNADGSDYTNAASEASNVISNSAEFSLVQDLNGVFLANNTEAIWQLQGNSNIGFNTVEGNNFILTAIPGGYIYNVATISPELLSAFEPGDKRKTDWINYYVDPGSGTSYPYPFKYKIQAGTTLTEYTTVFRLAELYLIRAEAEVNGAPGDAVADLNIIRNRAGLPNYSGPTDKASLLSAILHERQVEFFTEGHRWLDLKRTGNVNAVMSVVTPLKGGKWNPDWALYPIPQTERSADPNLSQNPGY